LTDFLVYKRDSWFEYKQFDNTNARREILITIREAGLNHTSGVMVYGGHSERDGRGAYLIPRPGNRIYGNDIAPLLPRRPKSTVACVLDGCHLGTFFDASLVPFSISLDNGLTTYSGVTTVQTTGQLIVMSATRENQKAHSISLEKQAVCSHGVLLGCLLYHLQEHRTNGINPLKLLVDLQPEPNLDSGAVAQQPFIASSRLISTEDFRCLPIFR